MPVYSIAVGQYVRSFDFESRDLTGKRACYIEGEVVGFKNDPYGCNHYQIRVDRQVVGGREESRKPDFVYPPVNGTENWVGKPTNCVEPF